MRRRAGGALAACVVGCALSAACSAAIDPAAIADARTAVRVKTALVNDAELGEHAIEVTVAGGLVTLAGRVATPQQVERAVKIARSVEGVGDVRSLLQVGGAAAPDDGGGPSPGRLAADPELGFQRAQLLLAVGGAAGWSAPRSGALLSRFTVSPIVKFGWSRGFGPAIGFGWFQADVHSTPEAADTLSRVQVRPVMLGAGYTFASDRISVSPSIVGGVAFNSLTITDTGSAAGVPVEVDNSLAWKPGVSAWFVAGRRIALNVSAGYLVTGLRITVLEGGRLEKRDTRGDTMLVHVGVAYQLF